MKGSKGIGAGAAVFAAMAAAVVGCMAAASWLERDFGKVDVSLVRVPVVAKGGEETYVAGKLYVPRGVSASAPAPAVLALHGYQNDKDTSAAYALELARRGIVALAIDQYGHGATPFGMRRRGWDASKRGPDRFKLFMSFSVTNDEGVAGIEDSSMGASAAFRWLAALPYVDPARVGVTGHSMGTWSAATVARENPGHAAVVLQCGEVEGAFREPGGESPIRNMLLLQARWDEFDYFRDYALTTERLNGTEKRYLGFAGQASPIEWNRTYGDFGAGTARRMELLPTVHRGVTHDGRGLAVAMDWFVRALEPRTSLAPTDQVFLVREGLVGLALLLAALSLLPLLDLLVAVPFFAAVGGTPPSRFAAPRPGRGKAVLGGVLLSGLLYPFVAQLGHGLFPYPQDVFRTLMAGGLILWLDLLAIVSLLLLVRWMKKGEGKRLGVTAWDLGLSFDPERTVLDPAVLAKTALMGAVMLGYLYFLAAAGYSVLRTDLRFIWPFLRPLTAARALQVLLYFPFFLFFFLVNGGARLFGRLRLPERASPAATQLAWWADAVVVMLGGLFLVALFEYVPFFLGFGTGWALVGLSLFDGPFMSALALIVPQFLVLFFVATYFFRKTGKVYLGSFVMAAIASWITCGGAAFF